MTLTLEVSWLIADLPGLQAILCLTILAKDTVYNYLAHHVLVFSKCFRAGFYTFSTFKCSVKGGTNSCKLCINKVKDLVDIYQQVCGPFVVSLLTDRHLKGLSNTDLFTFFQQRAFLRLRVMRSIIRCTQQLGHDILRCVSKFRNYELDN